MNVRALPTCRNPVGDGANRTRSISSQYSNASAASRIGLGYFVFPVVSLIDGEVVRIGLRTISLIEDFVLVEVPRRCAGSLLLSRTVFRTAEYGAFLDGFELVLREIFHAEQFFPRGKPTVAFTMIHDV